MYRYSFSKKARRSSNPPSKTTNYSHSSSQKFSSWTHPPFLFIYLFIHIYRYINKYFLRNSRLDKNNKKPADCTFFLMHYFASFFLRFRTCCSPMVRTFYCRASSSSSSKTSPAAAGAQQKIRTQAKLIQKTRDNEKNLKKTKIFFQVFFVVFLSEKLDKAGSGMMIAKACLALNWRRDAWPAWLPVAYLVFLIQ